jgi:hypothetical protein
VRGDEGPVTLLVLVAGDTTEAEEVKDLLLDLLFEN